jgi:hypothetical protein
VSPPQQAAVLSPADFPDWALRLNGGWFPAAVRDACAERGLAASCRPVGDEDELASGPVGSAADLLDDQAGRGQ